jgi:ABC-type sugar transport system ATPase subunit
MDEPTSSLQRDDVAELFSLIRNLRNDGISVIYISHFLEEVRQIADRYTGAERWSYCGEWRLLPR